MISKIFPLVFFAREWRGLLPMYKMRPNREVSCLLEEGFAIRDYKGCRTAKTDKDKNTQPVSL